MNILDELTFLEDFADLLRIPIIGREKGEWFITLLEEKKPKNILELGTAIAYSTLILASNGAKVTTIDRDRETMELAKENIGKFDYDINTFLADGFVKSRELSLNKKYLNYFDLIFLDFEKRKYLDVLPFLLVMLNQNGVLVADNIRNPKVKSFVDYVNHQEELQVEELNFGDGILIIKKKL